MPYKKYVPGVDELKPGLPIRLAGRNGMIDKVDPIPTEQLKHHIIWKSGCDNEYWWTNLTDYPDLEIFVQPLTIPRATKDALEPFIHGVGVTKLGCEPCEMQMQSKKRLIDWVSSLEVTND